MPMALQQSNPQPRVAIVVVHYKSPRALASLLDSLKSLSYQNYYIHIIENSSGARELLSGPNIELTVSPENGGFAQGCNVGIRHAVGLGAEYVWLLNPDTLVDPEALNELIKQSGEKIAAVGSKVLQADSETLEKTDTIWAAGGLIKAASREIEMIGSGQKDSAEFSAVKSCDYLPGCSLLLNLRYYTEIGTLPEDFFMYFEETQWCLEARQKGFELRLAPKSLVWHCFEEAKMQRPFTVYYYNRNRHFFWSSQLSGLNHAKYYLRVFLKELPQAAYAWLRAPSKEHKSLFSAHFFSALDFLRGRRGSVY